MYEPKDRNQSPLLREKVILIERHLTALRNEIKKHTTTNAFLINALSLEISFKMS
jgi:hypothetical protein